MPANDWFVSTGSSAKGNNLIRPLVDGKKAWEDVLAEINSAKSTIHLAFWMMHLDHEIERHHGKEFKDPIDREKFTLHDVLLRKREEGVTIRILLWILPHDLNKLSNLPSPIPQTTLGILIGGVSFLVLDKRILWYGITKKFQVILEPHPTHTVGSMHQKTIIIDDNIAFVGGMNARENDWDSFHDLYDYRRMPHDSSGKKRRKMKSTKTQPDYPPRHDFQARIEGPLVKDVQSNFIDRWNQGIKDKLFFSSGLTLILKSGLLSGFTGFGPGKTKTKTKGQIVRTMPQYSRTPMGEKGCLEIYQKAIRKAKLYIYIENQYFRSQDIAREIANAVKKNPKLIIIVVTLPDYLAVHEASGLKLASPSTYWTSNAIKIIEAAIPGWSVFKLMVSDKDAKGSQIYVDIDTHAKIMIIDDEWYTIGSCNINDRGFQYEGEINVAAYDPKQARMLRRRLWKEHLQSPLPTNDFKKEVNLWYDRARENADAMKKGKKPPGRAFAFTQSGPLKPIVPNTWF